MPRALSRDEQLVLTYVRHAGGSLPVPDIVRALGLPSERVQAACEYLISRGLLHSTVYAVAASTAHRPHAAVLQPSSVLAQH